MSPKFATVTSDLENCFYSISVATMLPISSTSDTSPKPGSFGAPASNQNSSHWQCLVRLKASLFSNVFAQKFNQFHLLHSLCLLQRQTNSILCHVGVLLCEGLLAGQRSLVALRNWAAKSWEVLGFGSLGGRVAGMCSTRVCGWMLCIV